jgi:hypothetical protein
MKKTKKELNKALCHNIEENSKSIITLNELMGIANSVDRNHKNNVHYCCVIDGKGCMLISGEKMPNKSKK